MSKGVIRVKLEQRYPYKTQLVLLIFELVMCAPKSNAALERFFSQLNYIKTNTRASLSSSFLNSLLRVKVTGPALQEFHNENVEKVA